jgi:hypothetical protein
MIYVNNVIFNLEKGGFHNVLTIGPPNGSLKEKKKKPLKHLYFGM